jgi:hypothetical protein
MNRTPSFYLVSVETMPYIDPRACHLLEVLRSQERQDDFLRVQIVPPLEHAQNHNEVVLATRYIGSSLNPISEWPIDVYVCRILNASIRNSGKVSSRDLQILFIGQLLPSLKEAEEFLDKFRRWASKYT